MQQRPVRRCAAALEASSPKHAGATFRRERSDLLGEAGLTDAGLAADQCDGAATSQRRLQRAPDLGEFATTTDEDVRPSRGRELSHITDTPSALGGAGQYGRPVEGGVVVEDLAFEVDEFVAGFDAELVGEGRSHVLVGA